jgi:hypothetical protein
VGEASGECEEKRKKRTNRSGENADEGFSLAFAIQPFGIGIQQGFPCHRLNKRKKQRRTTKRLSKKQRCLCARIICVCFLSLFCFFFF